MESELLSTLALSYAKGIGDVTARKLITHFGSAQELFKEACSGKSSAVSHPLRRSLSDSSLMLSAEQELRFCRDNGIEVLSFFEDSYPCRLKECADAPLILFKKGPARLEAPRIISIVGTRRSTQYGKELVDELVEGLAIYNVVVVSGLAFGIDINAHKASLRCSLSTIGVVAHGLDRIYPADHRTHVKEMLDNDGALVSDFPSGTKPDKENFPKRNRIIAGLSDAVVVVEARETGGALITADIANSYGREVFAYPGKVQDMSSKGCHKLIRNNQAGLICGAQDLVKALRWDENIQPAAIQTALFVPLSEEEEFLVSLVRKVDMADIDYLSSSTGWNTGKVASTLLNLEFSGVLKAMPGKVYRLNQ